MNVESDDQQVEEPTQDAQAAVAEAPVASVKIDYVEEGAADWSALLILQRFISREVMEKVLKPGDTLREFQFSGPTGDPPIALWGAPLYVREALLARRYKFDSESLMRITEGVGTTEESAVVYRMPVLLLPDGTPARSEVDAWDYVAFTTYPSALAASNITQARHDRIRASITKYLKAIGKQQQEIRVTFTGGACTNAASTDGRYLIELCGSPYGSNNQYRVPATIFGIRPGSGGNHYRFAPALSYEPIISPEGDEVGCYSHDRIYCYVGSTNGGDRDVEFFEKFFAAAASAVVSPSRMDSEESRKLYVQIAGRRSATEVDDLKRVLEDMKSEVENAQRELTTLVTTRTDRMRRLDLLTSGRVNVEEELNREFTGFQRLDRVTDVYWRGESLCIRTSTIDVVDPRTGHLHELGEFTIVLDCRTSIPRFFNRTRQVRGHSDAQMAPHVWSDGTACLGNVDGILPQMVGSGRLLDAAISCITFLDSVNVDDAAGRHVHRWPIKKRKEGVALLDNSGPVLNNVEATEAREAQG
jgi:hypothetical protein